MRDRAGRERHRCAPATSVAGRRLLAAAAGQPDDRGKARADRPVDVVRQRVADHRGLTGYGAEQLEREAEGLCLGLRDPELARDRNRVDLGLERGRGDLPPLEPRRPVREDADEDALLAEPAEDADRAWEELHLVGDACLLGRVRLDELVGQRHPTARARRRAARAGRSAGRSLPRRAAGTTARAPRDSAAEARSGRRRDGALRSPRRRRSRCAPRRRSSRRACRRGRRGRRGARPPRSEDRRGSLLGEVHERLDREEGADGDDDTERRSRASAARRPVAIHRRPAPLPSRRCRGGTSRGSSRSSSRGSPRSRRRRRRRATRAPRRTRPRRRRTSRRSRP